MKADGILITTVKLFDWLKHLIFILLLSACNTTPVVVEQTSVNTPLVSLLGNSVLVLPAEVRYQNVKTGEILASRELDTKHNKELLSSTIHDELLRHGLHLIPTKNDGVTAGNESVILKDLESNYRVLISSYKDKSGLLSRLRELGDASGASLICVATLVVEVGRNGGFEPISGGSWHGTNSSLFKIALITLATGETVWRNEVYVRELPTDAIVRDSVGLMLSES